MDLDPGHQKRITLRCDTKVGQTKKICINTIKKQCYTYHCESFKILCMEPESEKFFSNVK